MSSTPFFIDVTDHAVDRYDHLAGGERVRDDTRSEIRDLVCNGAPPTGPPSWLPTGERPIDDTRRYLTIGENRALVLDVRTGDDDRDGMVVLTVIQRPGFVADGGVAA